MPTPPPVAAGGLRVRAGTAQGDPAILGAAIRTFRQGRNQPHNGKRWTLDDLAAATVDDKAHLSRIERGLTSPSRGTLMRISEALQLSRAEAELLLRIGRFTPHFEPPDTAAAHTVIQQVAGSTRAWHIPFTVISVDARVWYANALWLRLVSATPRQFKCCMQGQCIAESYFDPCPTSAGVRNRYANYDDVRRRTLARLRRATSEGFISLDSLSLPLDDPRMQQLWDEAAPQQQDASLYGEQARYEYDYPGRGRLRFDTWMCPVQSDPRFHVIMQMPCDAHTREALEGIRRDRRPAGGLPCARHGYTGG